MSAGDIVLVTSVVLCALAFAALAVTLVRVRDTLGEVRREIADTAPLLAELRDATADARDVIDEARVDLARFDRVLGSAEAMSATATRARTTLSVPMIKAAGLATGTTRAVRRLRKGA